MTLCKWPLLYRRKYVDAESSGVAQPLGAALPQPMEYFDGGGGGVGGELPVPVCSNAISNVWGRGRCASGGGGGSHFKLILLAGFPNTSPPPR